MQRPKYIYCCEPKLCLFALIYPRNVAALVGNALRHIIENPLKNIFVPPSWQHFLKQSTMPSYLDNVINAFEALTALQYTLNMLRQCKMINILWIQWVVSLNAGFHNIKKYYHCPCHSACKKGLLYESTWAGERGVLRFLIYSF